MKQKFRKQLRIYTTRSQMTGITLILSVPFGSPTVNRKWQNLPFGSPTANAKKARLFLIHFSKLPKLNVFRIQTNF